MPDAQDAPRAKVALITGGTGGFGQTLARQLAQRGARVAVADLDTERSRGIADDLGALFIALDVSDLDANHRAVTKTEQHFGGLDSVFLNAGVVGQQAPDDALDITAYQAIVGANQHGVAYGIDAAVPALTRSGGGRIVITASLAGLVPMPGDPYYSMTKSAALAYGRAVAPRLHARGITVTIVCPGFADTPMIAPMREGFAAADFPVLRPEEVVAGMLLAHDEGEPGAAYVIQPGLPPTPYRFRNVPAARDASGTSRAVPADLSAHHQETR